MDIGVVKKLAVMARIDMSDEEMNEIAKDFDSILAYIGQVQEASTIGTVAGSTDKIPENYSLSNVMREDIITNKGGEFTDKILGQAPNTENGFLKVKQIL